jgi:hypothetical protein
MRRYDPPGLQRILDIDLDFFVQGVAHFRAFDAGRLDAEDFPPMDLDDALAYMRDRIGLRQRLPGRVVENHGDVFALWREGIASGTIRAPFHLTHVDAHGDFGLGETSHEYLLTELLWAPPKDRRFPTVAPPADRRLILGVRDRVPVDRRDRLRVLPGRRQRYPSLPHEGL